MLSCWYHGGIVLRAPPIGLESRKELCTLPNPSELVEKISVIFSPSFGGGGDISPPNAFPPQNVSPPKAEGRRPKTRDFPPKRQRARGPKLGLRPGDVVILRHFPIRKSMKAIQYPKNFRACGALSGHFSESVHPTEADPYPKI